MKMVGVNREMLRRLVMTPTIFITSLQNFIYINNGEYLCFVGENVSVPHYHLHIISISQNILIGGLIYTFARVGGFSFSFFVGNENCITLKFIPRHLCILAAAAEVEEEGITIIIKITL